MTKQITITVSDETHEQLESLAKNSNYQTEDCARILLQYIVQSSHDKIASICKTIKE